VDNGFKFLAVMDEWLARGGRAASMRGSRLTQSDFNNARRLMSGGKLDLPENERKFLEAHGLTHVLKPLPLALADLRQAWVDAQKLDDIKRNTEAINIFKLAQKLYDTETDERERLLAVALRCEIGAVCFQMSAEAVIGLGGGRAIPGVTRTVSDAYLHQLQAAQLPVEETLAAPIIRTLANAIMVDAVDLLGRPLNHVELRCWELDPQGFLDQLKIDLVDAHKSKAAAARQAASLGRVRKAPPKATPTKKAPAKKAPARRRTT
jgi:hypothetical protein